MSTLNDRINLFIASENLSVKEFEISIGMSNGSVSKMSDNTRKSTIDKICSSYPKLNRVWLLTGEGEMILTPTITNTNSQVIGSHNTGSNVKVNTSTTDLSSMIAMLQEQQRQNAEAQRQNANLQDMMNRFLTLMENNK